MSQFGAPRGIDPEKCDHVWDWVNAFWKNNDKIGQDRKCMRCKTLQRTFVCRDRMPCDDCTDSDCQCGCHESKKA